MPCGISEVIAEYRHAKPSSSAHSSRAHSSRVSRHGRAQQASTQTRPARKSQGRELRADAVKVRRPRASGVGAKRRTLHGVEHSSTLTHVTAGPVRARSEGRADLAGDRAQKPVVNVDLIHQQNARVLGAQIVVSGRSVLAANRRATPFRHRQASRGVNDPTGQARGHPARSATGSFTPRLADQSSTPWLGHGRHTAPPDRDDAQEVVALLRVRALQATIATAFRQCRARSEGDCEGDNLRGSWVVSPDPQSSGAHATPTKGVSCKY
jgi:hypothetical protein